MPPALPLTVPLTATTPTDGDGHLATYLHQGAQPRSRVSQPSCSVSFEGRPKPNQSSQTSRASARQATAQQYGSLGRCSGMNLLLLRCGGRVLVNTRAAAQHCRVVWCTALYCTVLYCRYIPQARTLRMYCTALRCSARCCTVLYSMVRRLSGRALAHSARNKK